MASNTSPVLGFGVSGQSGLLAALPPLSLYIHIPWCVKKCPYCDFNSHELKAGTIPVKRMSDQASIVSPSPSETEYIAALIADMESVLPRVWGRRIHTVFFGGGTPSVFSASGIDAILTAVRTRFTLEAEAEITLEANPGTFEADKFKGYRDAGVNRLSIGIQSFDKRHLAALGRVHDADEARRAVEIAQTHFDNINLDLMYALPQQSLVECAADIDAALGFGTNHLSLYHLTLEPNTLFHAKPPPLPDDDLAADMQEMIAEKLAAAGYRHYETSAYARPGRESKHNLNYWQFGDYIGIGAGAHAKISFPDRITREARHKQPRAFMDAAQAGNAIQEQKTVSPHDLPFEFMMNALRLHEGFPVSLFTERTGLGIHSIAQELAEAEAKGLITRDHVWIRPTAHGQLFLNELLQVFLKH